MYCRDEGDFSVDGLKVPVVDVTGAGDTFAVRSSMGIPGRWSCGNAAEICQLHAASRAVTGWAPGRAGAVGAEAMLDRW